MRWFAKKPTKEKEFWDWFAAHAQDLAAEKDFAKLAERVSIHLHRVDTELQFGIGEPTAEHQVHTLEISAGGLAPAVPKVQRLVAEAPLIAGWRVVAFRQPTPDFELEFQGARVNPAQCLWMSSGGTDKVDLTIYVPLPAGSPARAHGEIGFLILDHTVGEFLVITRIGHLDFRNIVEAPPGATSLLNLPAYLHTKFGV